MGVSGTYCEFGTPTNCAAITPQIAKLQCFYHSEYGSAKVDEKTWRTALTFEASIWSGSGGSGDRSDEHIGGFNGFKAIPLNMHMGMHAELGCGPWTQTTTSLLKARPDLTFTSITLSDPNLFNYMKDTATCSYRSGSLPGITTYLVAAGAEAPVFNEVFDSAMMVNVLEHVQNGYTILENLWRMIKPGGILIFNDRWWEELPNESADDNILHPVRIKFKVIDHFLSKFDMLFRDDSGTPEMHQRWAKEKGTYVIARKR